MEGKREKRKEEVREELTLLCPFLSCTLHFYHLLSDGGTPTPQVYFDFWTSSSTFSASSSRAATRLEHRTSPQESEAI